jgi:hypothetical protein
MLDWECGETAEQGAETPGAADGLCPRLRAHAELAGASPDHRVTEDQRPLSR